MSLGYAFGCCGFSQGAGAFRQSKESQGEAYPGATCPGSRASAPSPRSSGASSDALRVPGARGRSVRLTVGGRAVEAFEGETVLAALWAAGIRTFHRTARTGESRGPLCGIGICFDCLVTVDGERSTRACTTPVADGMAVELQRDAGFEGHGDAGA